MTAVRPLTRTECVLFHKRLANGPMADIDVRCLLATVDQLRKELDDALATVRTLEENER